MDFTLHIQHVTGFPKSLFIFSILSLVFTSSTGITTSLPQIFFLINTLCYQKPMAGERGQEVRRGLRFRYRKEPCVLKNLQQHNLHPELYFRVGGVRVFLHREETDCQSQQQRTLPALHSSQTPPPPSISDPHIQPSHSTPPQPRPP